eukprot:TRINITY_DN11164_c0_g2_i2.p1 TRINITY_DN11164_c0_g2~~TRINITY_DN11164_c0_g2_i2.p1  ORF type:complete len:708 (+),score=130.32 TRINITY_DN11164_c0_g2_i2:61-2124(+)
MPKAEMKIVDAGDSDEICAEENVAQHFATHRAALEGHYQEVLRLLEATEQQLRRVHDRSRDSDADAVSPFGYRNRDARVTTPPTARLSPAAPPSDSEPSGRWGTLTGQLPCGRSGTPQHDEEVSPPPRPETGAFAAFTPTWAGYVSDSAENSNKTKPRTPQAWVTASPTRSPTRKATEQPFVSTRVAPGNSAFGGKEDKLRTDSCTTTQGVRRQATTKLANEQAQSREEKSKQVAELSRELRETDFEESESDVHQHQPRALFQDLQGMKDKVKEGLVQRKEMPADAISDSLCGRISQTQWFDSLSLWVIAINAIWIAIDTDYNSKAVNTPAFAVFVVMDNFFCVFFVFEIVVRFFAFKHRSLCLQDAWFMFDLSLVVVMVVETWVLGVLMLLFTDFAPTQDNGVGAVRLLRLLRLTRMARMMRLMRALPELLILIKGIAVATRSVFFTMFLLAFVIYIFAILFVTITEGTPLHENRFTDIPTSVITLLLRGTLPDFADLAEEIIEQHWTLGILYLFFILLSSLTVMNMLVGILVEVVGAVSTVEREQMSVHFVKSKIMELISNTGLDVDGDMRITKAEFESLLLNKKAAKLVQDVGVDVVGLVDYSDFLFKDSEALTFNEFMNLVFELRGCNTATVKDIVDLRRAVLAEITVHFNDMQAQLQRKLKDFQTPRTTQALGTIEFHDVEV